MGLSRRTDLALHVLRALGDGISSADSIAGSIGTTTGYLPHVMAPLINSGWVTSTRGPNGGYRLEAAVDSLTMRDVVVAIEGPIEDTGCVLRGGPCPDDQACALHPAWEQVRGAIAAELGRLPVSGSSGGTKE